MKMRFWTSHRHDAGLYSGPRIVLVKEGFCWPAFFLPLPWALWHRMWLTALLLVVVPLLLGIAMDFGGLSRMAQTVAGIGVALYIGLNANDWRRASLRRKGWDEGPPVLAPNRDAAELRFFRNEGDV
ncbi:MAG: DUF2628 domain-containing protein, partial [Alphaproteobacteria bacterium]